jgi:hypothetical protein
MPRRLRLHGRAIEVVEVLDQWFGPDCRFCKLKGSDRALYIILRVDESRSGVEPDHVRQSESAVDRSAIRCRRASASSR